MFDMDSQPTIVKSVVQSAYSGIKSADSASNPLRITLWVQAFSKIFSRYMYNCVECFVMVCITKIIELHPRTRLSY